MISVKPNIVDKLVNFFSPTKGARRIRSRLALAALSDSGYIVPGSPRRSVKAWGARLNSPSKDIDKKLDGIKAASRDFSMNSPVAASLLRRTKTNVVGIGLQVQPQVDKKFLNWSDDQAKDFNEAALREFDLWSGKQESSYTGETNFAEDQMLLFCSAYINGDAFFKLPRIAPRLKGWPYETTLQLIDGDLIRTPPENQIFSLLGDTNAKIRNGVEYNKVGQLEAYWVSDRYPSEYSGEQEVYSRIPIYNQDGERQIFSMMEHERINQRRGIPYVAPVVELLRMLTKSSENELLASLISNLFTVLIKDSNDTGAMLHDLYTPSQTVGGGGSENPMAEAQNKNEGYEFDLELGPGNVHYLPPGMDLSLAESKKDRPDFAPFFKIMATEISAACNQPYDVVLLDFQKSYSALKGAFLAAAKDWKIKRHMLVTRVCQPVYEAILGEAILKNRLQAPGFFSDFAYRQAYCRSQWVGLGHGYLDPLNETRAAILKIQKGLSTRSREFAQDQGGRWMPMADELAVENQYVRDQGIDILDDISSRGNPNDGY